jgi:thiol-disulfide isomerase/thioredoxin
MTPRQRAGQRKRSETRRRGSGSPWVWWTVGAVVVIAGVTAVALSAGDHSGGNSATRSGTVEIASHVTVTGTPLPQLPDSGVDPAVGRPASSLSGVTFSGTPLHIINDGKPHAVIFVAHWCPHCRAEVPRIVTLARQGHIPVQVTGVATGTDASAPNYPPSTWLAREHWPYPVLVDTGRQTAATAYGLPAYPFLVFVDANGHVAGRLSGEVAPTDLAKIFAALNAGQPLPIPSVPGASSTSR